ncbi:MAG: hypothetical protein RIB60_06585 [Phycisphaerales bacterium]
MSVDRPRLTPDERYEAAAIAAARQRRNQPRGLVVLGGVLFLGACVALLGAWVSRASAQEELLTQRGETLEVQRLAAELSAYRDARAADPARTRVFAPDPNFRSKVANAARQVGLAQADDFITPQQSNRTVQGGRRVDWPYSLTDPDLEAVLEWIRLVTRQIPGTFVSNIDVRPQGNQWRVEVTLSYYEEQ